MTILFFDGFECYSNSITDTAVGLASNYTIATAGDLEFEPGRFGGRAIARASGSDNSPRCVLNRALGNEHPSIVAGYAVQPRVQSFDDFVRAVEFMGPNGLAQCDLRLDTGSDQNTVRIHRGSTVLATAPIDSVPNDVWSYIECEVFPAPAPLGYFRVWINGILTLDVTAANTQAQPVGGLISVQFTVPASTTIANPKIDDIYIATEKLFLPLGARIEVLRPNSDVLPNGMSPLSGADHFAMVDEAVNDGEATYLASAQPGQIELFGHAGSPFNPMTVAGVKVTSSARSDGVSSAAIRNLIRMPELAGSPIIEAVESAGQDHLLDDAYSFKSDIFLTDPQTGLEFAQATLAAMQFGVESVGVGSPALFDGIRVTLVAAEVLVSVEAFERAARLTQAAALAPTVSPSVSRVTQLAALAVTAEESEFARITQAPALIIIDQFKEARLSQTALLALVDVVDCATRWALCVKLTRTDGEVFAYTDFSSDLPFYGTTYKHCPGLMASAHELSAMLGDIGNQEFLGIIDDIAITERDLYGGLFDDAAIEVWQVPWDNNTNEIPFRIMIGSTGNLSQGKKGFKLEITTPSARLQQQGLLEFYTPSCRFELGDDDCTIDLEALRVTGTVTAALPTLAPNAQSRRAFIDTGRGEVDQYFEQGELVWTSGLNVGLKSDVKSFDADSKRFILWEPMIYRIEVGDEYSVVPGCDLTPDTCKVKFDNYINFGGFDKVPGSDAIAHTPNAKQ